MLNLSSTNNTFYPDPHNHLDFIQRIALAEQGDEGCVTVGEGGIYPTINAAWNDGKRQLKLLPGTHYLTSDLPYDPTTDGPVKIHGSGMDDTTLCTTYNGHDYSILPADCSQHYYLDVSVQIEPGDTQITLNSIQEDLDVGWYVSTDESLYGGAGYIITDVNRDTNVITLNIPVQTEETYGNWTVQPKLYKGPEFKHITFTGRSNVWHDGGNDTYWFTDALVYSIRLSSTYGIANNSIGVNSLVMNCVNDNADNRWGQGSNSLILNCSYNNSSMVHTWPGRVTYMNCTTNTTSTDWWWWLHVTFINCKFTQLNFGTDPPTATEGSAFIGCSDSSSSVFDFYYNIY